MKIVFCNGQPKSGSTFCFELVKRLVSHRVLRVADPEIRAAVADHDEAHKILSVHGGEYTGYVQGSIARRIQARESGERAGRHRRTRAHQAGAARARAYGRGNAS